MKIDRSNIYWHRTRLGTLYALFAHNLIMAKILGPIINLNTRHLIISSYGKFKCLAVNQILTHDFLVSIRIQKNGI